MFANLVGYSFNVTDTIGWVFEQNSGANPHGAFGTVRKVWRNLPGTRVTQLGAHKTLIPGAYLELNRTIETEIDALARFSSPYLPRYLDSGFDHEGLKWFVVEYLEGGTLGEYVNENGPLDETEWKKLAKHLAAALLEAHSHGIAHFDIKPDNVMRRSSGDWVLIDFGLSGKEFGQDPPFANRIYCAPEQCVGSSLSKGTPADMFSLGNTLYFAATGFTPWDKYTGLRYVEAIASFGPSLSASTPMVRELLQPLFHSVPQRRPTAVEFADSLNGIHRSRGNLPDTRIKSWAQFSDQIFLSAGFNPQLVLKIAQNNTTVAEIGLNCPEDVAKVTIKLNGLNLSATGRGRLSNLGFSQDQNGVFYNRVGFAKESLPELLVQVARDGLGLSLAELVLVVVG